jgi:competence protein ComEA
MKQSFIKISKRLERGIFAWLTICTLIIFVPRVYINLNPPEKSYYWEYNLPDNALKNKYRTRLNSTHKNIKLWKRCRPEELTIADWQHLGLSPKQAASVIKYRNKYGMYSLRQLEKIRVLDQRILAKIKDSLIFDIQTPSLHTRNSHVFLSKENESEMALKTRSESQNCSKKIDLNSATIEQLVSLPGVGSYSAEKIIQYRQRLGGFLTIDQLAEIKGLYPDIIGNMNPFIEIKCKVQPIALNSVTIERLKQHPYLSWNQANSIIKMRQHIGSFKTVEQIKQSVLIDEQTFEKLKPYLSL